MAEKSRPAAAGIVTDALAGEGRRLLLLLVVMMVLVVLVEEGRDTRDGSLARGARFRRFPAGGGPAARSRDRFPKPFSGNRPPHTTTFSRPSLPKGRLDRNRLPAAV